MASGRSVSIGPFSGGDGNTPRSLAFRANLVVRHRLGGEDVPQVRPSAIEVEKKPGESASPGTFPNEAP